ncbi:MAG: hypothetical protein IKE23_09445 [Exiguobacterium sp.]|nr:hypothetical protein [Exiguobacterium sp.]
MGGRGSGSGLPSLNPNGGGSGGGGSSEPMDMNPGNPSTLAEALGKKGHPMSVDRAIAGANPLFDGTGSTNEYNANCQRAVIATEARLRGYDVIASPTYEGDAYPRGGAWRDFFEGGRSATVNVSKSTARATMKEVEARMKEYGNGARATLDWTWKGKGNEGHVINVVQRNGKTYYYDGQHGGEYRNPMALFERMRLSSKSVELMRVDNLQFSEKAREAIRKRPKGL